MSVVPSWEKRLKVKLFPTFSQDEERQKRTKKRRRENQTPLSLALSALLSFSPPEIKKKQAFALPFHLAKPSTSLPKKKTQYGLSSFLPLTNNNVLFSCLPFLACQPFNSFSSPIFQTVTNPFTSFPWPFIAISPCDIAVHGNLEAGSGMEGHGAADKWHVSKLGWWGYEADIAAVTWCRWLKMH